MAEYVMNKYKMFTRTISPKSRNVYQALVKMSIN